MSTEFMQELVDRTRRIETRQASMMEQMGLNVASKHVVLTEPTQEVCPVRKLPTTMVRGGSINVTLRQLIEHLQRHDTKMATIRIGDTLVGVNLLQVK